MTENLNKLKIQSIPPSKVIQEANEYNKIFSERDLDKRSKNAQNVTDNFYNLITDIYEYGWGKSFHFAMRYQSESFPMSIIRHEHYIANKMNITPEDLVLDLGCGIMGPAREIARFTGAKIIGLNINDYQVVRSNELNHKYGTSHLLSVKQGDFMNIPFPDNHFDKIFSIEAICHAPNRLQVYSEMYRTLKPGGIIGSYEWCLTDKFDKNNQEHLKIKEMIEYGNSICKLGTQDNVKNDILSAGFDLIENVDIVEFSKKNGNYLMWYSTLEDNYSLSNIKHTKIGRMITKSLVSLLEWLRIAPEGSTKAQIILSEAATGLVKAGRLGIFTPMYLILAKKRKR